MTIAWVAVDKDEKEHIFMDEPERDNSAFGSGLAQYVPLPKGSIEKLTGQKLTWADDPIKIEGE